MKEMTCRIPGCMCEPEWEFKRHPRPCGCAYTEGTTIWYCSEHMFGKLRDWLQYQTDSITCEMCGWEYQLRDTLIYVKKIWDE